MAVRKPNTIALVCFCVCLYMVSCLSETDTLKQGHQLKGGEFLVSAGKVFTLGFFGSQEKVIGYFNPESAQNHYIGIWYTYSSDTKPVWIANRKNPISRVSGAIEIDSSGDLKISDNGVTSVMLNSNQGTAAKTVAAVLTDTGNFVLQEVSSDGLVSGKILWQSFDCPTDTLLPGMKIGFNFKTGRNWSLTSWISPKVPAHGPYTLGADPNGTNQLILWRRGQVHWRSGTWQEGKFLNLKDYLYSFDFVSDTNERYFVLSAVNTWYISFPMYQIDGFGAVRRADIVESDYSYKRDGVNSRMSELVDCKSKYDKHKLGCVEQKLPQCRNSTWFEATKGYVKSDGRKYEEAEHTLGLDDCGAMCLNNCTCVAYAYIYPNETGCEIWSNTTQLLVEDGYHGYRHLYVQRLQQKFMDEEKKLRWIWLIVGTSIFLLVLLLAWFGYRMKRILRAVAKFFCLLVWFLQESVRTFFERFYDRIQRGHGTVSIQTGGKTLSELELRAGGSGRFRRKKKVTMVKKSHGIKVFTFHSMAQATDHFALANVLGRGGYGTVYKGMLDDGQEIAIKRLSKTSKQGRSEFINEVRLVAKLQHTNLVRLIGCCIEQGEKIVVYEFMQNKSLDYFLFDTGRRLLLDWTTRFNIIEGVAQGLLYLHKYSRVKIIHRDLKTGNILLDQEMEPKISDFGMARLFELNETGANTSRVVGTLGYMSPEYALDGYFSVKSDVFSFGVLLLEIISSKKSNGSYSSDRHLNLIGYAWELWMENRGSDLIDNTLILSGREREEAMKCINLGLLCVQENASDRPTMSTVVAMISSEANNQLPTPKQPAFFNGNGASQAEHPRYYLEQGSLNDASISEMKAR